MRAGQKNAVKAGTMYLAGNIVSKAIAFLTIPIFTRLLTTSEYGIVNTYMSWVQIISVIMTLSLFNSFRTAIVEMRDDFDSYCASILRLGGLFTLAWAAAAVIGFTVIPALREVWWMAACCIIQAYGIFCVAVMSTKYMLLFRYRKRTLYMVVPNMSGAILAVSLLMLSRRDRTFLRIAAYVFVYIIFIAISLWVTRKDRTKTEYWGYSVRYSLPLVFHGLSLVVLSSSDRIMITHLSGASESGIYSLVYNLGLIATAVISSLEGIWLPWFIRKLKEGAISEINDKAVYMVENITAVTAVVILIAPELLQVMSSEQYWAGKPVIYPVIASSYIIFLYDMVVNVEHQAKETTAIAVNTAAAAAVNIILNLIFIPYYGAAAAAYTTVTAYLFSMILHTRKAKKSYPGIFPARKYALYFILTAGMTAAGRLTCGIRFAKARWILALILAVSYSYMMVRKERLVALQIGIQERPKKGGNSAYAAQTTDSSHTGCNAVHTGDNACYGSGRFK
jgi:O-antigen/teichoic acid export membrane protein